MVRFINDLPVWETFDGQDLHPAQPSSSSRSMPVLVLLPDRLFFFFQPELADHPGNHRQMSAAVKLQIEQIFPAASSSGNGSGVLLDAGRSHFLGYFQHPELAEFARRHHDILRRANAVTTPFFLAWNAGFRDENRDWIWKNSLDGTSAIMHGGKLSYFLGDELELRARLDSRHGLENESSAPGFWQLHELLRVAPLIGWANLRLPLPTANGDAANLRGLTKLCLAVVLLGGLFCLGQGLRLSAQQTQVAQMEQATNNLYSEVLSRPLGEDPFGRLLFRLSQLQGPDQTGPDALAMLGLLSGSAPSGFHVESFSMGANSGIVRARLAGYEELESLLSALESQDSMRFDLDQASTAEEDILVTLRVSY